MSSQTKISSKQWLWLAGSHLSTSHYMSSDILWSNIFRIWFLERQDCKCSSSHNIQPFSLPLYRHLEIASSASVFLATLTIMGRTSLHMGISESSSLFSTLLFFLLLLVVKRPLIQSRNVCSIPILSLSPFFNPLSPATEFYGSFPADTHALSFVPVSSFLRLVSPLSTFVRAI